jgi:hypothetical protein
MTKRLRVILASVVLTLSTSTGAYAISTKVCVDCKPCQSFFDEENCGGSRHATCLPSGGDGNYLCNPPTYHSECGTCFSRDTYC